MKRWQDWGSLVLGVWLLLSPWILGFSGTGVAMWSTFIAGVVVAVMAYMHLRGGPVWEEWVSLLLGIWLVLSPWIVGFRGDSSPTWNAVILGVLVGILAIISVRQPVKAT